MNSLVSVVIPCYNAEKWIAQAIESCLAQTYRPLEVIVVDDGSTDSSASVAQGYVERFPELVRFYRQCTQGAPVARNTGAALAAGSFLLFLDADDYLLNDALQYLVGALKDSGDIAYGNATLVNSDGTAFGTRDQKPRSSDWVLAILENNPITSSVLFRREVIETCRWDPGLPCNQDNALHATCAIHGFEFRFIPCQVAAIRQHDSPTRISVRTHPFATSAETLANLHFKYQQDLELRKSLTASRKICLNYKLLENAVMLWRFNRRVRAQQVFSSIDKKLAKQSPNFKYKSYYGIAAVAGLRASHAAYDCRQHLKRLRTILRLPMRREP